jgi:phospholipase/lecithinase/hemolysin
MKTLHEVRTWWALGALVACCVGAAPAAAALRTYSALYAFGDSLSDPGNLHALTAGRVPGAPYFDGRFSSGYTFVDQLSLHLFGSPSVPFVGNPGRGTNFAVGGAKTNTENFALPSFPLPTGMLAQFSIYDDLVDQGDSNALYVVYGGANDMFDLFQELPPNPADWSAARDAVIGGAMQNISSIVSGLAGHGAVSFLVPNLPDLGAIPRLRDGPLSAFASETSQQFNVALDALVDEFSGSGLSVYELNVFSLLQQALADPAAFGFTDATDPCYKGDIFDGVRPDTCADPSLFVFWDSVHPSGHAHEHLGTAAFAVVRGVPEPQTSVLLLLFGLFGLVYAVRVRTQARGRAS